MTDRFTIESLGVADRYDAVVVGASAGGVDALMRVFEPLDERFPIPVAVVLHLPPSARESFTEVFSRPGRRVKEAEDKEPLSVGTIYFAPPNYHLLVEKDRSFSLSVDEPVHYSRPSIDVLFETAAMAYGARVMGVVLTGASADGARGLRAIVEGGGVGVVQNPITAQVATMPQASLREANPQLTLTLEEIARLFGRMARV